MGSGDLLRCSRFSVWQLLFTAFPLEQGYPHMSQAPSVFFLAVWRDFLAGSNSCICPGPVSCPPAAAGGEGQSSRTPCVPDESVHWAFPGTFIPNLIHLGAQSPGEQEIL